ncbi:Glycosyltransferase involved in cell wall bisynthesis [Butyrivibrio proteoclasticus]|uniref:Glycosyltransferase involved in cell wall bisynthesis n=1 Tax=Butyrivibrio proteoclasticus TaxID=43305 RepID=A0A1I5PTB1_9FIRM|nr:glycosyltransferase family 1 protein [Butyrivibrio proteoclasticus]SFP37189.1 Glycosyltransferase involved in cell wall bisynthesis [Butyrivibrio proteoclasticus]
MRIGIDARTLSYEYTGIPIFVYDVLKCWNEENTDDEFFLYSNRPFELDFKLKDNWHIVIDEYGLGTIWVQLRLAELIKKDKLDVFWEPMNFLPRKVRGTNYCVTVHDLAVYKNASFGTFKEFVMERLFIAKSCRTADKIIAISEATKREILNELKVSEEKVKVIHNGDSPYNGKEKNYSDYEKKQIQKKWNVVSNKYLLYVGTIEPRKNITTIVKAFNVLKANGDFEGKLVLAGKRGWKSDSIFQTIMDSTYKDDIVVTGYVTEIEKECLYREASCLLFPSFEEGFGFPIVEAMSVGLVVITADTSSMPEVGGDVAFYVNKQDICNEHELARQVNKALGLSDAELKLYAERAKKRALTFNRHDAAQKILKELKSKK